MQNDLVARRPQHFVWASLRQCCRFDQGTTSISGRLKSFLVLSSSWPFLSVLMPLESVQKQYLAVPDKHVAFTYNQWAVFPKSASNDSRGQWGASAGHVCRCRELQKQPASVNEWNGRARPLAFTKTNTLSLSRLVRMPALSQDAMTCDLFSSIIGFHTHRWCVRVQAQDSIW